MPADDDVLRAMRELRATRSRREFLVALGALGLGAAAVACTKSTPQGTGTNPSSSAAAGSILALVDGNEQLSLFSGGGEADAPLVPGKQLFGFALTTQSSNLVTGGTPQVYIAKDQTSKAAGPFPATWYPFTGYDATHDHSPRSPIAQGLYSTTLDFAGEGNWYVAAVAQGGSGTAVGVGAVAVAQATENAPGSKAVSVKTPVATSGTALEQICTRTPACHMHTVSLDAALGNGKPTVVTFSTPALCQSELCGPVTDEQILVSQKDRGKANFIHVEEFLRGPDLQYPAATGPNRSPGFKAWHLLSEPWVFVIDRKGVISARLGPGPVVAPQIEEELNKVL
jgi:hypothetical protein